MNSATLFAGNEGFDLHNLRHAVDAADRGDIADQIETEIVVERGIDRVVDADDKERVAVRRGAHDPLHGEIAARAVLDYELLANPLRQRLSDQARKDVDRLNGGEADDQAHRRDG